MDDAVRHLSNTASLTEIVAYGVGAIVLVYHVPFGNQRSHPWLLRVGDWRLGLVKGQMDHGYGEFPDIARRHRIQLHVANLFANARRQHDRSHEIRMDAGLVAYRRRYIQSVIRVCMLFNIPK